MQTHIRDFTFSCLLITLSIILGYIENLFLIVPYPGVKFGFSNIAVILAMFKLGFRWTLVIGVVKTMLCGILFSGIISILYGSVSIVISVISMYMLIKRFFPDYISEYGISTAGSSFFNISQIVVASLWMKTTAVYSYMPYMILVSVFTGLLTAFITRLTIKKIRGLK